MKQFYAYDACSSEIVERASSLFNLLNKWKGTSRVWLARHLGEKGTEPLYFYEKKDIHGNDDDATQIPLNKVREEAVKCGILTSI